MGLSTFARQRQAHNKLRAAAKAHRHNKVVNAAVVILMGGFVDGWVLSKDQSVISHTDTTKRGRERIRIYNLEKFQSEITARIAAVEEANAKRAEEKAKAETEAAEKAKAESEAKAKAETEVKAVDQGDVK